MLVLVLVGLPANSWDFWGKAGCIGPCTRVATQRTLDRNTHDMQAKRWPDHICTCPSLSAGASDSDEDMGSEVSEEVVSNTVGLSAPQASGWSHMPVWGRAAAAVMDTARPQIRPMGLAEAEEAAAGRGSQEGEHHAEEGEGEAGGDHRHACSMQAEAPSGSGRHEGGSQGDVERAGSAEMVGGGRGGCGDGGVGVALGLGLVAQGWPACWEGRGRPSPVPLCCTRHGYPWVIGEPPWPACLLCRSLPGTMHTLCLH